MRRFRNFFVRQEEELPKRQIQPKPVSKKGKCKIRFKKTADGEIIEFSPECKPEQIEMAKRMREEYKESD